MTKSIVVIVLLGLIFFSCKKETDNNETPFSNFTKGKNRFTLNVNGDVREYIVHVPINYNATTQFPVVFMLHGSSGNGEKFYNISGWKEVGDTNNIITVFPSSWEYCILENGVTITTTKWNTAGSFGFCVGEVPRNDIKFLATIITDLATKYKIDNNRIYLVGFSNGAAMAAKCAVEMSDKFAAVCANSGSLPPDTTFILIRKLPILLQVGNKDPNLLSGIGATQPLPLNFNQVYLQYPQIKNGVRTYINSFKLDSNFIQSGNSAQF